MRPLCSFALVALALPTYATAQLCVDQEFVPSTGNGLEVTNRQSVAQVFTVGLDGQLAELDLLGMRHHRGTSSFDLRWEIVTADSNGVPTSDVLASGALAPSALSSSPATLTLDLRSYALIVLTGDRLAIHLDTDSQSGGATYAWAGDAPGSYARGDCFIRRNVGPLSYDMGFRTRVEKSPGPLLSLEQTDGSGSLRIRNYGGVAGELYILALSFDVTNAAPNTGTGPWAGLYISVPELITQIQIGAPFVGAYDANGRSENVFGPGTIPPLYRNRSMWGVRRSLTPTGVFTTDSNIAELPLR